MEPLLFTIFIDDRGEAVLMEFNLKCGAYREKKFIEFQYKMNDGWVKSVDEERDLGVLMSKDLQFSKQYLLAKSKANLMLGIINRGVLYKIC